MGKPHAIVIPYPVQGHVIPYMELSHRLVEYGFLITFVNTEFNHKRILKTMPNDTKENHIDLVSVSDGLSGEESRNDLGAVTEAVMRVLPKEVESVIMQINNSDDKDDITCVISDMGWVLEVGDKMGLQTVALWTVSAGLVSQMFSIPKLIHSGIINSDGTPLKEETIQLSPTMPVMKTSEFVWACIGDLKTQKIAFDATVRNNEKIKVAKWHVCNSSYDLEPAAFNMLPDVLSIGPLLASTGIGKSLGHFWSEDSACINWLNQQQPRSVVYVAFGSLTIFDSVQFQELALGLELSGQPFLWVVRPDMTEGSSDAYPEGFLDRVNTRGKMVGWAPQQIVLSHPSIACFLSHCGWNSTLESVSYGVPFLCWPYFADQFHNQSQICDVLKIGLRLNKNDKGIISSTEIKTRIEELLESDTIITRMTELKETVNKSLSQGGSSLENFNKFVKGIQKP